MSAVVSTAKIATKMDLLCLSFPHLFSVFYSIGGNGLNDGKYMGKRWTLYVDPYLAATCILL